MLIKGVGYNSCIKGAEIGQKYREERKIALESEKSNTVFRLLSFLTSPANDEKVNNNKIQIVVLGN